MCKGLQPLEAYYLLIYRAGIQGEEEEEGSQGERRKGGLQPLDDLNKFSFPKTKNMSFLILCLKLHA